MKNISYCPYIPEFSNSDYIDFLFEDLIYYSHIGIIRSLEFNKARKATGVFVDNECKKIDSIFHYLLLI